MILRKPVAAGAPGRSFYLSDPEALKKQIKSLILQGQAKSKVIGCVLPHAGYEYSGKVAASVLSGVEIPDKVILLGPNHTGNGAEFSIMSAGAWQTPLGAVKIDEDLAKQLLKGSSYLADDYFAHEFEHSLEVELPLLQFFKKNLQIVPIAFLSDNLAALKQVGKEVAAAIAGRTDCLLVASSDMTHYEPKAAAEKKDKLAIDAILRLDEDALMQHVREYGISMCGYAPVIAMISAARQLGAKKGKLIKYETSGESTGDFTSVVGYAGITIS